MAIGQCRSGGITVATVAQAHGADNVVPDNEDSGESPLPHRGYPIWASKKKYSSHFIFILIATYVYYAPIKVREKLHES